MSGEHDQTDLPEPFDMAAPSATVSVQDRVLAIEVMALLAERGFTVALHWDGQYRLTFSEGGVLFGTVSTPSRIDLPGALQAAVKELTRRGLVWRQ